MEQKTKVVLKRNLYGFLFVLPLIIYFLVFQLAPMIIAFALSFTEYDGLTDIKWVGLDKTILISLPIVAICTHIFGNRCW